MTHLHCSCSSLEVITSRSVWRWSIRLVDALALLVAVLVVGTARWSWQHTSTSHSSLTIHHHITQFIWTHPQYTWFFLDQTQFWFTEHEPVLFNSRACKIFERLSTLWYVINDNSVELLNADHTSADHINATQVTELHAQWIKTIPCTAWSNYKLVWESSFTKQTW